ncbi:MAG: MaoC family dehydratase [Proteobacteria bacterium]|nr:MaoC family dehydratase [Pseudomonadota bacterium]
MTDLYLEDFKPGDRFESRGRTVPEAEIIDFALRYDPQPIHIDAEAAKHSPYGGLIASGFHTMAVAFRLAWDTGIFSACSLGSPGIDELRWLKPVRPGDTLRTVVEIVDARPSASKPDRGVCRIKYDVFNQNDEQVMTMTAVQILARRPQAAAAS